MNSPEWIRAMRASRKQLKPPVSNQITTFSHGVICTTSPLTVYLDGATMALDAHLLGGYTPTVNDVVLVLNESGMLSVIQKWVS